MSLISTEQAIALLKSGGIVALPTETVYGLSARIDLEEALKNVFATKQRPSFDPLIVHVRETSQARALCSEWPDVYDLLAQEFWPGPLTLVAQKRPEISSTISAGLDTVAVRCPNHPVFLSMLEGVGVPLAAPSANRFGRTSPTTAQHVESEFNGNVAVVDGGACTVGVESTVLTLENSQLKILRPGGCTREALEAFLKRHRLELTLTREASVHSPGNLKEHYQPQSPLVILENQVWSEGVKARAEEILEKKIGSVTELTLLTTPQDSARILYSEMRRLSRGGDHILWIQRTQAMKDLMWEVIWDRLERASSAIIH